MNTYARGWGTLPLLAVLEGRQSKETLTTCTPEPKFEPSVIRLQSRETTSTIRHVIIQVVSFRTV
jgi:hypothetical protein